MPPRTPNAKDCRAALHEQLDPELFRALSDPSRLVVLCRLIMAHGPLTVTEISECCGVHLSGVSRHLAILRDAGMVAGEKNGREVRYRLQCESLTASLRRLADTIDDCRASCCGDD